MENSFLPKSRQKEPQNRVFSIFLKILSFFFPESQCKMKVLLILDRPSQTPCLEKSMFWSNC